MEAVLRSLSPQSTVLSGPFKGMHYPTLQSVGSTLPPKILGCYEQELHETLETICQNQYTEIVDVGCAEGYYAVGLAMRLPKAHIYAFDTNQKAITLCREMAALNGVGDRVETGAFCDANTLRNLKLSKRALIISDCEGYERELFDDSVVRTLRNHDVLVEVHDFIDIEISTTLKQRFKETHSIQSIFSIDDIVKAHTCDDEQLKEFSLKDRFKLLAEHRPGTMEWLYMTAFNHPKAL